MGKLRAWIVKFQNGSEGIYLLEPELFKTADEVIENLNRTWGLSAVLATCQVGDRREEITRAVDRMCMALNTE